MPSLLLFQKIHEPTLKIKVNRLIKIGVFKKINNFQSAAPSNFIIPKINGEVRFTFEIIELNKRIKRKPFPIPTHSTFITQTRRF